MNYQNLNYTNFSKKELDGLITKAKNGDNNAFSNLSGYLRHISYTYFHSKYKLGKIERIEDVEDLSNNVYLAFAEQYNKIVTKEYLDEKLIEVYSQKGITFENESLYFYPNRESRPEKEKSCPNQTTMI